MKPWASLAGFLVLRGSVSRAGSMRQHCAGHTPALLVVSSVAAVCVWRGQTAVHQKSDAYNGSCREWAGSTHSRGSGSEVGWSQQPGPG